MFWSVQGSSAYNLQLCLYSSCWLPTELLQAGDDEQRNKAGSCCHRKCSWQCKCVVKVIIALLLGYMVAAVITSDGGKHYVTSSDFETAPSITFLWVRTFGFGFYAPAVLPFLIGMLALITKLLPISPVAPSPPQVLKARCGPTSCFTKLNVLCSQYAPRYLDCSSALSPSAALNSVQLQLCTQLNCSSALSSTAAFHPLLLLLYTLTTLQC